MGFAQLQVFCELSGFVLYLVLCLCCSLLEVQKLQELEQVQQVAR